MSLLRDLQKYAINKDFFEEFYRQNAKESMSKQSMSKQSMSKQSMSKQYTSLFWTFYALVKNEHELNMAEHHQFKMKNEFSMSFVEQIKKNKAFLKQNKLKFHDIESSILYNKDIDLMTLKALTLLNNKNLIYIWNNKYYVFESNDDDTYNVIERNREQYSFDRDLSKVKILQEKTQNKLLMEDTRTQLKSMSSYKLGELQSIATLLGIQVEKKKTKQLLYEEINSKID